MGLATVSVTVPEERIPDLLRYAADLNEVETEPSVDPQTGVKARWGWGRQAVHDAYLGGTSESWRPFLDHLAEHADEWVTWEELLKVIDFTAQQGAGMLGAAERRCKGRPPYEKRITGNVREFRMPSQVAEYIMEVASE
jgi:hypothetical protein